MLVFPRLNAATVTWDAGVNTTWDTATANWSGSTYANGDDAQFLGSGLGTVTLSGSISPGSVTVNNSSGNYIFSGNISGSGGLTKEGAGNLRLTGANTYTGATNINNGTLWLGNGGSGGSLNTASAINIASGATFRTKQTDDITQGIDFSGGAITGSGGITHDNAGGTLILNAANTYTGGTFVFRSRVRAEHDDALGTGLVTLYNTAAALELVNGITIDNDITFVSNGNQKFIDLASGSATISSNSTITTQEAAAVHARFNPSAGATLTVDAQITGSGGVTKYGAGTVIYTNATNNFTGYSDVYAGTLQIGGAGRLGSGNYSARIAVSSGATFQYSSSASGASAKYQGNITGAGTLIKDSNDGELRLMGSNTIANIEINQGILDGRSNDGSLGGAGTTISLGDTSGSANATLQFAGTRNFTTKAGIIVRAGSSGTKTIKNINGVVTENTAITLNDDLTINDANALTLGGVISGTGGLTKIGSGTTTLSGSNTYSGITTIDAGILQVQTDSALGSAAGGTVVESGATLRLNNGANIASEALTLSGTLDGRTNSGNVEYGGAITLAANAEFFAGGSNTMTISGNVDGAGNQLTLNHATPTISITGNITGTNTSLVKIGTGTTTLSGSNTYTGTTTISAGTLTLGGSGVLGSGSYSSSISNSGTFTVNSSAAQTLSGVISGTGALIKDNAGTLTLSGSNTYTGATTINAGTLQISGSGSLSTSSAVTNNATLIYGTTIASGTYGLSSSTTGTGTLTGTAKLLKLNGDITQDTVNLTSDTEGPFGEQGIELVSDTTITADSITLTGDLGRRSGQGGNLTLDTSGTNGEITLDVSIGRSGDWFGFKSFTANAGTGNLTVSGANAGSGGWRGTSSVSLTGTMNISSSFSLSGSGAGPLDLTATGNSSVSGNLGLVNTTNTWTVNPGLTMDVSGAISGTGAAITKNGTGTLTLSGSNTYSGGTTLNAGTLVIGNSAAAGTGTITQADGTSLLKFDTTGTVANDLSIYNVATNQTVTLSGAITAQNTTYDVASGTTTTLNGTISGSGGITKNGTGTLVVEGNNSYTGNTTVNDGILQANAANALGNSTVTVNGGSLLVTASNAINDSKGVTLAGGTLAFNGTVSDSIGALTLSADSIIDLGTGSVSASFADLAMGLYNLSIYNWTGTTLWEGGDGNNTDKIYFNTSLSSSELQKISFYSDFGSSFVGTGFQFGAGLYQNEVIPVPEPETWATAALLLIGGGIWMWRKRRAEA